MQEFKKLKANIHLNLNKMLDIWTDVYMFWDSSTSSKFEAW